MIEATFPGEVADFNEKVFAQGAADTTIRHFDHFLLRVRERSIAGPHQGGVDVDLAHVVDDHRHLFAFTVAEDMIQ